MKSIFIFFLSALLVLMPGRSRASQAFVSASNQGLSLPSAPINTTNIPLTVSFWIKPTALTANMVMFMLDSGSDLGIYVFLSGGKVRVQQQGSGASTAADLANGTWQHIAARWDTLTSRSVWLDGTKATDTTLVTAVANFTHGGIGCYWDGATVGNPCDALIAEVRVWNASVSDADIAAIYAGGPPMKIANQAQTGYWPLGGGILTGAWAYGLDLTNQNASTANNDHPRVYR